MFGCQLLSANMSHSMKEKPEWVRMGSFPKADPAYYPTVTVIERANTEELERQDSRPDLSKALPRKPAKQLFTRLGWLQFVGPNHSTRPHELTILLSLFVLIAFVVILSLAAKFPVKGVLITFVSISGLGILGLFGTVIVDLVIRGWSLAPSHQKYHLPSLFLIYGPLQVVVCTAEISGILP